MPTQTYKEWKSERSQKQKHVRKRNRRNITKTRYTPSERKFRGASVKYNLEEKVGDAEEQKEHNIRTPFVTLLDHESNAMLPLPSGLTRGQAWGIMKKAWLSFRICKSKNDLGGMIKWAHVIRKTQDDLGIALTQFYEPITLDGLKLSQEEREFVYD